MTDLLIKLKLQVLHEQDRESIAIEDVIKRKGNDDYAASLDR